MIHAISLCVSFPVFGNNFYSQPFVSRKELSLVFDKNFEALLIPAAAHLGLRVSSRFRIRRADERPSPCHYCLRRKKIGPHRRTQAPTRRRRLVA